MIRAVQILISELIMSPHGPDLRHGGWLPRLMVAGADPNSCTTRSSPAADALEVEVGKKKTTKLYNATLHCQNAQSTDHKKNERICTALHSRPLY